MTAWEAVVVPDGGFVMLVSRGGAATEGQLLAMQHLVPMELRDRVLIVPAEFKAAS